MLARNKSTTGEWLVASAIVAIIAATVFVAYFARGLG